MAGALLLAGCGDEESDTERRDATEQVQAQIRNERVDALLEVKQEEIERRRANPDEVLAPERFRGALADRYETDREICKALSPEEIAGTVGVEGDDPEEVAEAYSERFPGSYREAARLGCLAGFESS